MLVFDIGSIMPYLPACEGFESRFSVKMVRTRLTAVRLIILLVQRVQYD